MGSSQLSKADALESVSRRSKMQSSGLLPSGKKEKK